MNPKDQAKALKLLKRLIELSGQVSAVSTAGAVAVDKPGGIATVAMPIDERSFTLAVSWQDLISDTRRFLDGAEAS